MNPIAVVIASFIEANSSMIRAMKRVFLVQVICISVFYYHENGEAQ